MAKADYTLVDIDTNNVVGVHATEEEALAVVRDTVARYGQQSVAVQDLGLHGPQGFIATGSDLALRALKHVRKSA